jgi:hypothetical protein
MSMMSPPSKTFAVVRIGRFVVVIGDWFYQRFDREAITTVRPHRFHPLSGCSEKPPLL